MTRKQKLSLVFNALIFVFTAFATVSMIIGFQFMGDIKVLSSTNFKAFKYFTVDSNVFAGIISLIYLIFLVMEAKGRIKKFPEILHHLKLAATTGVTLTMMVTVFFLAPRTTTTYFDYFKNSNFFMHFLTPLLCIITFVFFEPVDFSFAKSTSGIIPMVLYAFYYIPNIIIHLEDGKTSHTYDWYGFLDAGFGTIWFVMPLLLLVTWIFAIVLWFANKKLSK